MKPSSDARLALSGKLSKLPGHKAASRLMEASFDWAPQVASLVAFAIGAVALMAAVTPTSHRIFGLSRSEILIQELPELSASVAGTALMALALGLRRRIDTALVGALGLLGFFAVYAFVRREHIPAAAVCVAGFVFLFSVRHAFYRRAGLAALAPSRPLYLAIAVVFVMAAIGGVLWASEKPGFAEAPWWALLTSAHIGRPGRALAVGILLLAVIGMWQMTAPARRAPSVPTEDDTRRAKALLASAQSARPDIQLALLGDKSFFFSEDQSAFVMAARAGASLVALGTPVGQRAAWRSALAAMCTAAEQSSLRPVVYSAPPDVLPELIELGFRIEKIGENAIIDLASFSLVGKQRQDLRTARRRMAEREGAVFEMITPPLSSSLIEALEPVSQAWLAGQQTSEKTFSLGRFDPAYLANFPLAVVRLHGRPAAFANLWTTPDKQYASLDLMRYDPQSAPNGIMDFLISEIILWAQREGFARFDLGMAPLSGLAVERHAPLFQKLGRLVYEEAGALYNFKGLRNFKAKFGPSWEPRYLAAKGSWSMTIVLAEIALLTSGGTRGLFLKPVKAEASGA